MTSTPAVLLMETLTCPYWLHCAQKVNRKAVIDKSADFDRVASSLSVLLLLLKDLMPNRNIPNRKPQKNKMVVIDSPVLS